MFSKVPFRQVDILKTFFLQPTLVKKYSFKVNLSIVYVKAYFKETALETALKI